MWERESVCLRAVKNVGGFGKKSYRNSVSIIPHTISHCKVFLFLFLRRPPDFLIT